MDKPISVQASTITTVRTISSFSIRVQQLDLFKSVSLVVMLFDTDGNIVETKFLTLEGEDYLGWNNDDQYIVNYVANKLNLNLESSSS